MSNKEFTDGITVKSLYSTCTGARRGKERKCFRPLSSHIWIELIQKTQTMTPSYKLSCKSKSK